MNNTKNPFKKGDIVQFKHKSVRVFFKVYRPIGDHIQFEIVGTDVWYGIHPAIDFEKVEHKNFETNNI